MPRSAMTIKRCGKLGPGAAHGAQGLGYRHRAVDSTARHDRCAWVASTFTICAHTQEHRMTQHLTCKTSMRWQPVVPSYAARLDIVSGATGAVACLRPNLGARRGPRTRRAPEAVDDAGADAGDVADLDLGLGLGLHGPRTRRAPEAVDDAGAGAGGVADLVEVLRVGRDGDDGAGQHRRGVVQRVHAGGARRRRARVEGAVCAVVDLVVELRAAGAGTWHSWPTMRTGHTNLPTACHALLPCCMQQRTCMSVPCALRTGPMMSAFRSLNPPWDTVDK